MSEIDRRGREPFDDEWVKTALLDDREDLWPLLVIAVCCPDLLILIIAGLAMLIGWVLSL